MAVAETTASAATKRADLPVRVASAAVMLVITGLALWLGGWVWNGLVLAIVVGVLFEWAQLVLSFERRRAARGLWLLGGVVYLGLATYTALIWLGPKYGQWPLPFFILVVIAIDVGAYFAGRTFGGPKIAPKISPSKTWSGLGGAIIAASAVFWLKGGSGIESSIGMYAVLLGAPTAIIAQSGDFFESWMKRRAGVKDSGALIPGHGGLFDRADGLIALLFVNGLIELTRLMVN